MDKFLEIVFESQIINTSEKEINHQNILSRSLISFRRS